METDKNIYTDYAKIKMCIESCKTNRQLGTCLRMSDLFESKFKSSPYAYSMTVKLKNLILNHKIN